MFVLVPAAAAAAAAAAPCCCCCSCCFLLLLLLVLSAAADSSVLTVRRGSFSPDGFSEQEEGELSPALLSDDDGTLLCSLAGAGSVSSQESQESQD